MIAESQDEKSLPNRIIYTCSLRYIEKDIVMYLIDKWIQDNCSQDPDIDALLDAADLTRQLIQAGDYEGIIRIVIYTVEKDYYECFSSLLPSVPSGNHFLPRVPAVFLIQRMV